MILLADGKFKELLAQRVFQRPNPYNIRIASLYKAYSGTGLADFWIQADDNSRPVSFLAKTGGSVILDLTGRSDTAEVTVFLEAFAQNALYNGRFTIMPRQWQSESGVTMRYTDSRVIKPAGVTVTEEPDLYALHNLLLHCASKDIPVPAFEEFYPDLSHKLRHGCAHVVGVMQGSTLAAAALCLFRHQERAVVGSVACAPPFRSKGYGTAAVSALLKLLQKDGVTDIYLHRAQGKNEPFYQELGFTNCGTWKQCGRNT